MSLSQQVCSASRRQSLALFWCSCPLLEDVIADILEPVWFVPLFYGV